HRRPRLGPPPVADRRQGPVHPRDRGGLDRGRDRHRRAFDEGHAHAATGRLGHRLPAAAGGCPGRLCQPA
ncbi:porphobilinogen deaminase, partial [Aspergillus sp. HF37]